MLFIKNMKKKKVKNYKKTYIKNGGFFISEHGICTTQILDYGTYVPIPFFEKIFRIKIKNSYNFFEDFCTK